MNNPVIQSNFSILTIIDNTKKQKNHLIFRNDKHNKIPLFGGEVRPVVVLNWTRGILREIMYIN